MKQRILWAVKGQAGRKLFQPQLPVCLSSVFPDHVIGVQV